MGYTVHLFFLSLPDAEMAINRVAERVRQGGRNIPDNVVRRRYTAGLKNFHELYKNRVDACAFFDHAGREPILLDEGKNIR